MHIPLSILYLIFACNTLLSLLRVNPASFLFSWLASPTTISSSALLPAVPYLSPGPPKNHSPTCEGISYIAQLKLQLISSIISLSPPREPGTKKNYILVSKRYTKVFLIMDSINQIPLQCNLTSWFLFFKKHCVFNLLTKSLCHCQPELLLPVLKFAYIWIHFLTLTLVVLSSQFE